MSELPADVWVPVPLRWRHVVSGDVIIGKDGALWLVTETNGLGRGVVTARRTTDRVHSSTVDPDDLIHVLVPVPERDAIELASEQLGAQVIERRTLEGSR